MRFRSILMLVLVLAASASMPAMPAGAWCLYRLQPAEITASSTAPGVSVAALNDGDELTAWRPATDDAAPWVEFRYAGPVDPGFVMITDASAAGIGLVKTVTATTGAGDSHSLTVPEFAEVPAMRWTSRDTVRSLRFAITRCEGGSVGLADLAVIGRRPADPDALTLDDLARCTLTLECDLELPGNRPSTQPVSAEVFYARDGFFPWSLQLGARDRSSSDRIVRAGKSFTVVDVMNSPQALVLRCDDGSMFGLFDESRGGPASIMDITGHFTMTELNEIFAGVVRFSSAQGREVEDY
ncbi:hypothetical protein GF314_02040 [bacterium]|nr:hypothetical protein [bacterium]